MSGYVKQIAILASATDASDKHADSAQALGGMLSERGYELLIAGNVDGTKGAAAYGALSVGGNVRNVYADPGTAPYENHVASSNDSLLKQSFMVEGRKGVKSSLTNRSDMAVLLPGGFEELDQAVHLARKGTPLVVVNENGFYNGLKEQVGALKENAYAHNFAGNDFKHIHFVDDVSEVVPIAEVYNAVGTPENDYAQDLRNARVNNRLAKPSREGEIPGFTHRGSSFILATDAGIDALDRATTAIMEERGVPMTIDNSTGYYDGLLEQVDTFVEMGTEKLPQLPQFEIVQNKDEMNAVLHGDHSVTHSFDELDHAG